MAVKRVKKNNAGKEKSAGTKSRKAVNKGTAKSSRKSKKEECKNPANTIILFSISILLFCLTIVPGEHLWLFAHNFVLGLFGICALAWPGILLYIAISEARGSAANKIKYKVLTASIGVIMLCSMIYVFSDPGKIKGLKFIEILDHLYRLGTQSKGAGIFSGLIGVPLVWLCGAAGARIISIILLFISIMLITSTDLLTILRPLKRCVLLAKNKINKFLNDRHKEEKILDEKEPDNNLAENENASGALSQYAGEFQENAGNNLNGIDVFAGENKADLHEKKDIKIHNEDEDNEFLCNKNSESDYKFPSIDLLSESSEADENDAISERQRTGRILVETLESFNVKTNILNISRGPSVTRYELQPAAGVKISKITNLADDIALSLAASGVRIEAPIPGKSAVGIEVPNKVVNIVRMRELISSQTFSKSESNLTVVLGRDISGKIAVADLSRMPHLLIAGSTGSGKSVCINSFIISLIYKSAPEDVRLLMVDPKVVELGVYNGIPHLLVPVVTDPRKAAKVLNWAVRQMLDRYKLFAENNVRDLPSYNSYVRKHEGITDKEGNPLKPMPQIVIIIDELADLMMVAPNEVEDAICRLAQMARAAGMHLVIATQRPSVDVITGIIKANIPSRIALAVSSQVDSRTIIDTSGAEKLLGRGDMLFLPIGENKPIRVQGCYVSDSEIESIVAFIKECSKDLEYDEKMIDEIESSMESADEKGEKPGESEDPLMNSAIKCVIEAGQASTSLLQRRLKLGYARAGRLIDEMEQKGIVGPHEGSKPRRVLINYQQYLEMNMNKSQ